MNIILVGFMGTGKSTVASALEKKLGWPVCELDEQIVQTEGKTIPQIFEEVGEEGFRDIETRELKKALEGENRILSGGGGVILREENRRIMKSRGTTVRLLAEPETVLRRVYGDTNRPNLKGRMSLEGIAQLMEQRRPFYEAAADFEIVTDGKTAEKIAEEITEQLGLREKD